MQELIKAFYKLFTNKDFIFNCIIPFIICFTSYLISKEMVLVECKKEKNKFCILSDSEIKRSSLEEEKEKEEKYKCLK